jgi:hypothetical protein
VLIEGVIAVICIVAITVMVLSQNHTVRTVARESRRAPQRPRPRR